MRLLTVCLMVLAIAFLAAGCRGAEPSKQPPYTFTINGLPFTPRVFSLHGDPDHPAPGDLIALGTLLLTLGPERDCHFIIKPENKYRDEGFEKVLLRLADGRQRVVGVRVFANSWNRKENIVNPLPNLPADTIHGLWGVYIGAWSDGIAEKLRQIDPPRMCITVAGNALIRQDGQNVLPPLPKDIQYLNTEGLDGHVENGEPLRQWTRLRFLRIEGNRDKYFDAQWLAHNRGLCRLDLTLCAIEHPEALSRLDRLECLDLSNIPNLATVGFAETMTRLRSLNLADTAVGDVYGLEKNTNLTKLDVSNTKVSDLSIRMNNLEELDLSATMVRDLSPLWKLKSLKKITASHSTVETLASRPMPALRTLTVIATPLSQAAVDAFVKLNPKCDVIRRRADALRCETAGATRLRIRSGGLGYSPYSDLMPFLHPGRTLFEIADPAQIHEFVGLIEVDEKGPDLNCMCYGDPTIEFYRGEKLIAAMNWKHDLGFEWPGPLTPQSLERSTKWLADHGYDVLHEGVKRRLAEEKLEAEQRVAIVKCYPERARHFFDPADDEDDQDDQDAEGTDNNAERLGKPAQVAKAVGDPVELAVITCRAVGSFHADADWTDGWTGRDPYLVVESCRKVSDKDFLKALDKVRGDKQGELGAARLCFREKEYRENIPQAQREDRMFHFAVVLLDHGEGKPLVRNLLDEGGTKPGIDPVIRKIARGELGRDGPLEDDEIGLRAYTYMTLADRVLAEREEAEIKPEVQDLLAKTARKPDIAALEVALALLGDAKRLKPEHLKADSPVVDGALRAIERFNGREDMDILMEAGLDNPDGYIQKKSLLLFERMIDQNWYSKERNGGLAQFAEDDQELSGFIKDARRWWREHGAQFVARRRAEK